MKEKKKIWQNSPWNLIRSEAWLGHFMWDFPLNISGVGGGMGGWVGDGGSVPWRGSIQYKCFRIFCQMWEDLPPLFPKFGGQVANLVGGKSPHPSLQIHTSLGTRSHNGRLLTHYCPHEVRNAIYRIIDIEKSISIVDRNFDINLYRIYQ